MHSCSLRAARAAAIAGAGLALALPAVASGKPVAAHLRVEATGKALDAGTRYITDTAAFRTSRRNACRGSGRRAVIPGPTALGVLRAAAGFNRRVRPVGVTDRFEFGVTVCSIGAYDGWMDAYWLYRVNHRAPEQGADAYRLRPGDQVLWYFSRPEAGVNTGDELALSAPARVERGRTFTVRAFAYDSAGRRRPAAGARVRGVVTDASGQARMRLSRSSVLRATRGADIASPPLAVCVGAGCPGRRGRRIVGSGRGEALTGTRGPDRVWGRGGRDRVRVRGGGRDRVSCGAGRDVAYADASDVVRGCERVVRRG